LDGRGPYADELYPHLRALGTIPQRDRLVLAVHADHDIHTFDDLRRRHPALKIATAINDGVNHIGMAAHRIMELAGVPRERLESWGGRYLEGERPTDSINQVLSGAADAIFHEAIMTQWWQDLAEQVDLTFVPVEREVLGQLARDYGWPSATLPAGYLRGLDRTLETLDFSDFLLIARAEMTGDVAELIAWCIAETRDALESQYRHIPPERSPVTWPLVPATLARTAIPLHPGARTYYASKGYLEDKER
ncbi:MAG: TAXI family TRAP transporter solute-binding subunit, partial [Candidatus Binataceae bacterium]